MAAKELIQRIELSGSAASITFSNIPQTFTDLYLVCSLRTTATTDGPGSDVLFNGSSSGFSTRSLQGNGSSAASFTTTSPFAGVINANNTTSNTFSNMAVYIPNYTSSVVKSYSADAVQETNGTTAYPIITAGLWNSTSAITSITIRRYEGLNDLMQYSSASLYGFNKGTDGTTTVS